MSGYMYAGIFGSGILFFIASTIPGLVHTKGVCLIYLASVEGLEFEEAEAALAQRMAEVKQRAEAARERSMQATHQRPAASAPVQPSAQTVSPVAGKSAISACPKCGAATTPGDIFCESCGQRLST